MIGRTNGGGMGLNFKVLGGTAEPAEPKENTIWVNTAAPITSWDFSAEEPIRRSSNRNLLVYPYYRETFTQNDITWTVNTDGSVMANGTASSTTSCVLCYYDDITKRLALEPGTYHLSGCPAGGSEDTYFIRVSYSYDEWATNDSFVDVGAGATITFTERVFLNLYPQIKGGATVSNLVFKPQLEKGSAATEFVKGDATGQVWIATGSGSTAPFNALRKNALMVYPIKAYQYINGAWASKTAKSYQGGVWVEWLRKLYSYGNTVNDVTGGWKGVKDEGGAFAVNSDHLYIGYSGGTARDTAMYTVNKIDTTGYSKLKVYVNITATQANYGYGFSIGLSSSNTSYSSSGFTAVTERTATGYATMSLDISNYQGSYYIKLQAEVSKANVYEVWLER